MPNIIASAPADDTNLTAHLAPDYEAEIRDRIDQLDDDRTFAAATWLASSVSSKSVLPPEQSHVVEDVLETKHSVIRASVGVFGDKRHAEFTAHARDDVPALLDEIDRLRAELAAKPAEVLAEAAEVAVRAARACGDSETGQYAASVATSIGKNLRRMASETSEATS